MAGPVYIADAPEERAAVVMERLVAMFHAPSGMTHLLAPPGPEILDVLGQGPADADAILDRLAVSHAFSAEGARDAIAARLDELEASGLVARV